MGLAGPPMPDQHSHNKPVRTYAAASAATKASPQLRVVAALRQRSDSAVKLHIRVGDAESVTRNGVENDLHHFRNAPPFSKCATLRTQPYRAFFIFRFSIHSNNLSSGTDPVRKSDRDPSGPTITIVGITFTPNVAAI